VKKLLIDYIREESQCNYADIYDYFKDLGQCDNELKVKYLMDLFKFIEKEVAGLQADKETLANSLVIESSRANDLYKQREQHKEKIDTALYELDILYKKVNPTEHSSIDSHFKRIIDNLKND
jgi:hypothetical protein